MQISLRLGAPIHAPDNYNKYVLTTPLHLGIEHALFKTRHGQRQIMRVVLVWIEDRDHGVLLTSLVHSVVHETHACNATRPVHLKSMPVTAAKSSSMFCSLVVFSVLGALCLSAVDNQLLARKDAPSTRIWQQLGLSTVSNLYDVFVRV